MANYLPRTCPKLPWIINFHTDPEGAVANSQIKAAFCSKTIDHDSQLHVASKVPPYTLAQIMATIGVSSESEEIVKAMMEAGMRIARIKMADYDQAECKEMLRVIRKATDVYSKSIGRVYPLPIALELRGQDIQTGSLKNPKKKFVELPKGHTTYLTSDTTYEEFVTEDMIYVDYENIEEVVTPGDLIAFDNGSVTLMVKDILGSLIRCVIERAGRIGSKAKVSLPEVPLQLPSLSSKDKDDLMFAIREGVDFIVVPNVTNADTLRSVREMLSGNGGKEIQLIAKIETVQGVYNVDEIIDRADAVLIARAALSVSLSLEKVFLAQKSIIAKCNKAGSPVFVSQLVTSTTHHPLPTKSEVDNVATAVLDGMDGIVCSRETSTGQYPVDAIRCLTKVCRESEAATHHKRLFAELTDIGFPVEAIEAISMAAVDLSIRTNSAVIVLCTTSGRAARLLSKYRPRCPIIAITRYAHVARQLNIHRAIYPLLYLKPAIVPWEKDVDVRVQYGITFGKLSGYIRAGDVITMLLESRRGAGFVNTVKVVYASEFDTISNH